MIRGLDQILRVNKFVHPSDENGTRPARPRSLDMHWGISMFYGYDLVKLVIPRIMGKSAFPVSVSASPIP